MNNRSAVFNTFCSDMPFLPQSTLDNSPETDKFHTWSSLGPQAAKQCLLMRNGEMA
jgi:hypothetical protein